MEIFVDGGLFELTIAAAFGYLINYIFLKKYLLIVYSIISIMSPFLLFFIRSGEFCFWLIGICFINSILLTILLWRERMKDPNRALFNSEKLSKILLRKKKGTGS